jgi:hypothetical protein
MSFLNKNRNYYAVGLDVFRPYLMKCHEMGVYDDLILCDAKSLPLRPKSFDIVLCIEVLEHMRREEGEKLLRAIEEVARTLIVLSTPVGKQRLSYDPNPYQEHKYIWKPIQLQKLNYKLRGSGLRDIYADEGFLARLPRMFGSLLFFVVWILASPITYTRPDVAGNVVGIKYL